MKSLSSLLSLLIFLIYPTVLYSAPFDTVIEGLKSKQTVALVPIKEGNKTILTVVGSGVPPDPGEAGDQTIQGIDSDNDGIRDDVERQIGMKFPNDSEKRAYHYFLAMKYQELIDDPSNVEVHNVAIDQISQAESCLDLLRDINAEEVGGDYLIPIIMNTYKRSYAYIDSMKVNAGKILSKEGKECRE